MRALDTNVLARWLLRDNPAQAAAADRILAEPCHISMTVLLELGWVLTKSMRLPRAVVAEMMSCIIDMESIVVERSRQMGWAIERFRSGADWGDVIHLVANSQAASGFATFDKALVRKAAHGSPLPLHLL